MKVSVEKKSRGHVWRPGLAGGWGTRGWQHVVSESGEPHKAAMGSFKMGLVNVLRITGTSNWQQKEEMGPQ